VVTFRVCSISDYSFATKNKTVLILIEILECSQSSGENRARIAYSRDAGITSSWHPWIAFAAMDHIFAPALCPQCPSAAEAARFVKLQINRTLRAVPEPLIIQAPIMTMDTNTNAHVTTCHRASWNRLDIW